MVDLAVADTADKVPDILASDGVIWQCGLLARGHVMRCVCVDNLLMCCQILQMSSPQARSSAALSSSGPSHAHLRFNNPSFKLHTVALRGMLKSYHPDSSSATKNYILIFPG